MYDTNMEAINNSSSGPTYELVETNNGTWQMISVNLEQSQENATNSANTHTLDEEHYYHALESGGHECVPEGGCVHEAGGHEGG